MSLFDKLGAAKGDQMQQLRNNPVGNSQQSQLQFLMSNPAGAAKLKGWDIPQELMGNPEAMVKHLIQTGQVGGPLAQRIAPAFQKMWTK